MHGTPWKRESSSLLDRVARLCLFKSQTDTVQLGFLFFSHHLRHFHSPSGGIRTRAQGSSMFPMGCIGTDGMEHPERLYCFSSRHCSKVQARLCLFQTITVTHLSCFMTYQFIHSSPSLKVGKFSVP